MCLNLIRAPINSPTRPKKGPEGPKWSRIRNNKCGSGHRKPRVYVVKNPDHIGAYITFPNLLQLPRTK